MLKRLFVFTYLLSTIYYLLFLSGCATGQYTGSLQPSAAMPGTYHRVMQGETLWRISKMYGVDIDELARVNRIQDATVIETGSQLFIPSSGRIEAVTASGTGDDFIWPLKGAVVRRFLDTAQGEVNKGLDIRPFSNPEVVASRAGSVVFASSDYHGLGRTIIIDHHDGLFTVYGRNSEISVRAGQKVARGELIGRAGQAGRDKSEYLHFEIRQGHKPKNPYYYLP